MRKFLSSACPEFLQDLVSDRTNRDAYLPEPAATMRGPSQRPLSGHPAASAIPPPRVPSGHIVVKRAQRYEKRSILLFQYTQFGARLPRDLSSSPSALCIGASAPPARAAWARATASEDFFADDAAAAHWRPRSRQQGF